jgi:hypothetical protein
MEYKVRDLIKYLMDFNMDAEVTLNITGVPEKFDISWSGNDGDYAGQWDSDVVLKSKRLATEVHFNVVNSEK